jgi:hypothetical protein
MAKEGDFGKDPKSIKRDALAQAVFFSSPPLVSPAGVVLYLPLN